MPIDKSTERSGVIAVVGPTASGKSTLADALAYRLQSEVISADAMQVYRRMDIGTAKMPVDQRRTPLRCIDLVDPGESFSAALFAVHAHRAIDDVIGTGRVPVVCGGTGLYVRAALENMAFPAGEQSANPVRERYQRHADAIGAQLFHKELEAIDPESAALIHPNNVRRVVRAFELLEQGTTYAVEHATLHERIDRHPTLYLGLNVDRATLYRRIDERVDDMVAHGLLDEVERLMKDGLGNTLTARQAIGYKEFIDVLEGSKSLQEAIDDVKRSTRRYAKRQMTWFRADSRIVWLDANELRVDVMVEQALGLWEQGRFHVHGDCVSS